MVDSFRFLGGPEYDTSTPLGAFCWARWEIARAYAFEAILGGKPPYDELPFDEEGNGGTAFKVLREELVRRARRGDDEAVRVLLDAADVRTPGEYHSVASTVEGVDAPGVRETALSAGDPELRWAAEALFAWVDEYKRAPVSEASALEEDFIYSVGLTRSCEHPTPPGMADTFTIEELRALTLEEVENLTSEQLREIDIETAFNEGLLLRDYPLDLQLAWGEKSLIQVADHIRDRCCYNYTVEELVERFARLLEKLSFVGNENDPSTPLGAYCWSIWEVYRSEVLHSYRYFDAAIFDLLVAELRVRVEMGVAGAADALREVLAEAAPTEYPFAEALASVDDPRVRGTALSAEDPVLLEAVRVFYDLVDKYRQEETPSPYAFMGEFLPRIMPELAPSASSRPQADVQALDAFLKECKPPGNFAS